MAHSLSMLEAVRHSYQISGTGIGVEVTQWPKLAGRHRAGEQGPVGGTHGLISTAAASLLPVGLQASSLSP